MKSTRMIKIKNTKECPFCHKKNKCEITGHTKPKRKGTDLRLDLEMSCDNCGAVFLMHFNAKPTMAITTVTEPQSFLLDS